MNNEYLSEFAHYISSLVATKRASGYKYETAEYYLQRFDAYCCSHANSKFFSKDLILGWAKAEDGESPRTHRTRISPIRELGKYMQAHGVSDAFILPSGMHRKIERYVPHYFTNQEIINFFSACDNLKAHAAMHARHLVLPVFFRLLYCCGLRTCEARALRVENVDLKHGIIDIIASKSHRSRRIPVSQDLLTLFKVYDERVAQIYSGRVYFFPTTKSACYDSKSIGPIFRKIWKAAGLTQGSGNRPRAYDFRHHFALSNLNNWIASGVDVNSKLPYLTKYMGHSSIESTDYYLHLVPEFFQIFSEKVKGTETLLPEVNDDYKK